MAETKTYEWHEVLDGIVVQQGKYLESVEEAKQEASDDRQLKDSVIYIYEVTRKLVTAGL